MAYVIPQGTIHFYKNVPLNPTYNDVLFATSPNSILGKIGRYEDATLRCNQESYTRVNNESKVRVGLNAEKLYTCNYMSWENNGFGQAGMWFFAFIVNVEYINNNCTEVTYLIDDMSTWFPYCELKECYVERETPASDNLYEHLEPENLAIGELIETQNMSYYDLGDTKVLFMASTDVNGDRREEDETFSALSWVNGIKSALCYEIYDCESPSDMNDLYQLINDYSNNGQAENIIAIMLVPEFLTENIRDTHFKNAYALDSWTLTAPTSIDGYIPKNKKLFTYPYSRIQLSNTVGGTNEYRYEDFLGGVIEFQVTGCAFGTPSVMVEPRLYLKHVGADNDQSLLLTNFPQAPCFNDSYRAYLAQNKNSLASQAAWGTLAGITSVIIGAGLTFGTGGAAAPIMGAQLAGLGMMTGGIISAGSAIAKPLATDADAKNLPVKVSGLVQADALNLVKGVTQIQAKFLTVKREYAEMIDSYFSAYGYTCNKVKVPNISARAIWNFTKTQGCCVVGNAPAMALKNIADIFDHGVRFWKDPDDIGNYSGNN
jgi:hypothetical protein